MRLIDADAFKEYIDIKEYIDKYMSVFQRYEPRDIKMYINAQPTIDAVPVVRCKDCIYFHDYGDGVKNCWSDGGGIFTKDDDFCSHAERKDG